MADLKTDALRLADALRNIAADTSLSDRYCEVMFEADDELRRLHAEVTRLRELLGRIRQWDALDIPDTDGAYWRREIDAALEEQPEQEPVAWMYKGIKSDGTEHGPYLVWKPAHMDAMSASKGAQAKPLYAAPLNLA